MKATWLDADQLKSFWQELSYEEVPFAAKPWWESLPTRWGGVLIEQNDKPVALWLFAVRSIGFYRLYRQPLVMPWIPVRLSYPLDINTVGGLKRRRDILNALAEWIKGQHFAYIGCSFAAKWSYLPPFFQHNLPIRAYGSFILRPGAFHPSKELLRKVKRCAHLPIYRLSEIEALSFWQTYRPAGVKPTFSLYLEAALRSVPSFWRAWGIGEPLQAVGIFLWGNSRVWYIAGSRSPDAESQVFTRLLYEAIQAAQQEDKIFDFYGSLIRGIENFFQQYGGEWENRYILIKRY
ncbi:MAG: hypothetical protein RMJ66_05835 [Bacteroidia bacterium]|nr:hypothetical protein [Bacteroidia bacterium]MDW8134570.1 hypothetical protein [Bacteroidia bacterium]